MIVRMGRESMVNSDNVSEAAWSNPMELVVGARTYLDTNGYRTYTLRNCGVVHR